MGQQSSAGGRSGAVVQQSCKDLNVNPKFWDDLDSFLEEQKFCRKVSYHLREVNPCPSAHEHWVVLAHAGGWRHASGAQSQQVDEDTAQGPDPQSDHQHDIHTIANLRTWDKGCRRQSHAIFCGLGGFGDKIVENVASHLAKDIDSPTAKLNIFFTGHGCQESGNWSFGDRTLSLKNVVDLVESNAPSVSELVIYADCCFAGHWALGSLTLEPVRLKKLEVIAACAPINCTYFGTFPAAIFAHEPFFMKKLNHLGFMTTSMLRDVGIRAPLAPELGIHCMYGVWSDSAREIRIEATGGAYTRTASPSPLASVRFQRAVRDLSTLKVSDAVWNAAFGFLSFQVSFPGDSSNSAGKATWKLFHDGRAVSVSGNAECEFIRWRMEKIA